MTTLLKDSGRFQPTEAIREELQEALPWLFAPAFQIGDNEGYNGSQFGTRAGPLDAKTSYNVLHEVGHAVDMTMLPSRIWKRRVLRPDFEMRIHTYMTIGSRRYYEPVTMQATERECRVGGIQLQLLEAGGYKTDEFVEDFSMTLKYIPDWPFGGCCPYNAHDVSKFDADQRKWLDTRMHLVRQSYEQFSLSDIQDRWDTVMAWLAKKQAPQNV